MPLKLLFTSNIPQEIILLLSYSYILSYMIIIILLFVVGVLIYNSNNVINWKKKIVSTLIRDCKIVSLLDVAYKIAYLNIWIL